MPLQEGIGFSHGYSRLLGHFDHLCRPIGYSVLRLLRLVRLGHRIDTPEQEPDLHDLLGARLSVLELEEDLVPDGNKKLPERQILPDARVGEELADRPLEKEREGPDVLRLGLPLDERRYGLGVAGGGVCPCDAAGGFEAPFWSVARIPATVTDPFLQIALSAISASVT